MYLATFLVSKQLNVLICPSIHFINWIFSWSWLGSLTGAKRRRDRVTRTRYYPSIKLSISEGRAFWQPFVIFPKRIFSKTYFVHLSIIIYSTLNLYTFFHFLSSFSYFWCMLSSLFYKYLDSKSLFHVLCWLIFKLSLTFQFICVY